MENRNKLFYSIATITLTLTIFYIYNIIHFINGNEISSPWFINDIVWGKNDAIGITSITLGFLGGLLGTISIILLIFKYRWYWWIAIAGQSLTIIDSIITGVFLTAISYSSLIFLLLVINNYDIEIKEWILILIWSIFIIVGLSTYLLIFEEITLINFIDCFCAGLSIYGWFHIANEHKRGYILFILNDLLYIFVFATIGLPVVSISFLVYGIINTYCLYVISQHNMNNS